MRTATSSRLSFLTAVLASVLLALTLSTSLSCSAKPGHSEAVAFSGLSITWHIQDSAGPLGYSRVTASTACQRTEGRARPSDPQTPRIEIQVNQLLRVLLAGAS